MKKAPVCDISHGQLSNFHSEAAFSYAFGLAYADHIRETAETIPEKPVIFLKHGTPVVNQETVKTPSIDEMLQATFKIEPAIRDQVEPLRDKIGPMLDYEIELGVQILEDCKLQDLEAGAPLPRIGYFLANDLTTRTVQLFGQLCDSRLPCWTECKSFDGFFPTADTLWVPNEDARDKFPDVTLHLKVNGKTRQKEPVSSLIYTPRELLTHAARFAPGRRLNAGDLLVTGTPAGVTFKVNRLKRQIARALPARFLIGAMVSAGKANSDYLKPGDVIEADAEWLGSHSFTIT
ncbi:fumarylacetoacetate hydrolase family protein [Leisingera sp. HS039]|uniref:fumarylacetoacetate hydrolase family protein n=1 Tax=unclassified Leisingera TaxID=2614906 RepID=UPI00107091B2|nr:MULTISPECIES: fumarylacetoacetate hydrolase family protein [unclassified Leisingera]MBQ4826315.1 fumarylacetoacetate hydrolase family protein [Leisingera sp. HS039]QBR37848.1 hypothetical protein ETW23_18755 [Leisingera sp. NJS201]